jgi:hypothetical protein
MSDYSVGWPLWDDEGALHPSAFDLSHELTVRLHAWQQYFEDRFHYRRGWRSADDAAAYAREGRELHRLLTTEIGGWADVDLDLWPTSADQDRQPWS